LIEPGEKKKGLALAKEIKAADYVECSAYKADTLKVVFESAMRAVFKPPPPVSRKKKRGDCCLL
jgi:hypothetical protein